MDVLLYLCQPAVIMGDRRLDVVEICHFTVVTPDLLHVLQGFTGFNNIGDGKGKSIAGNNRADGNSDTILPLPSKLVSFTPEELKETYSPSGSLQQGENPKVPFDVNGVETFRMRSCLHIRLLTATVNCVSSGDREGIL